MRGGRSRLALPADGGPVHADSAVGGPRLCGLVTVEHPYRPDCLVRLLLDSPARRAGKIMVVILLVHIVDDRRVVDDRRILSPRTVIPVNIAISNILAGDKRPVP